MAINKDIRIRLVDVTAAAPSGPGRRKGRQQGFTLIEVLVAMVIFSVGILAVMTMQSTSIRGNLTSRQVTEAAFYASSMAERLLNLPYTVPYTDAQLIGSASPGTLHQPDLEQGADSADGAIGYVVTYRVINASPANKTKTITITATSKSGSHSATVIQVVPETS